MSQTLTQVQADWIRVFHEELPHVTRAQFAREYNVHVDTIRNVLNGTSFTGKARKPYIQPRKLEDHHVRDIRLLAGAGWKEAAIATHLKKKHGVEVARATVRQVINGRTYQDVL